MVVQKWTRGFVDRQWVALLREETRELLAAQKEEEEAAMERYATKTSRANKVQSRRCRRRAAARRCRPFPCCVLAARAGCAWLAVRG